MGPVPGGVPAVVTARRSLTLLLFSVALAGMLAYLRDPAWLAGMTSGMQPWTTDADGRRVRWIGGRSSFFVPADARSVTLPIRTTFDNPADWPVKVTVTLDDRPVEQLTLEDSGWRTIEIRLPPEGTRRHRRIDIHLDRVRVEGRGALLGEVEIRR